MMPVVLQAPEARPKYLQLVERLRRQIETGELQPGDQLPTYSALRQDDGMTQPTVDRAFALLEQAGLIYRIQGRGTFVANRRPGPGPANSFPSTNSRTIVAFARPDYSFFDRCAELLYRQAQASGLSLICHPVDPGLGPAVVIPEPANRPMGCIVFSYSLAPLARELQAAGCRVVIVGAPPAGVAPDVSCVYGDHEYGGFLVTRHLLELGHRSLVFAGNADLAGTLRYQGHQRAILDARREVDIQANVLLPDELAGWQSYPGMVRDYFRRVEAPTAVVAWNDYEAIRLLGMLTRAGICVPGEVSLVGYDDLPQGRQVFPALTTVDHQIGQQLQAALNILSRPDPPPAPLSVLTMPTLMVRESSAAPPADKTAV